MKMRLERSTERDKRENNLCLNYAQSEAERILNRLTSHKRSTPIMMLDRMEGNAELKTSVQQMLATRRLTHSVLLVGEAGLGTGFAARCIAADYLYPAGGAAAEALLRGECCRAVAKAGKRDSGTVETGIVREAISVSGMGSGGKYLVGQVTAMRSEIFNTSLSAEGRAVLLYHVERMNEESANALLKVMEEPPEGVLFLLTADSLASVLPTIRSRCVSFAVAPVSPADCTRYCAAQEVDKKTAALYSELFDGHIGTVLAVARDEARAAQVEKALELARAAAARDSYTAAVLLAAYEKDKAAAAAAQPQPEKEETGDALLNLDTARRFAAVLEKEQQLMQDAQAREELAAMHKTTTAICDWLEAHPESLPKARRFAEYYIPTTLKLLHTYNDVQGQQGENAETIRRDIAGILHTLNQAYENLYNNLLSDVAMDISSEIAALQGMLANDGLTGREFE